MDDPDDAAKRTFGKVIYEIDIFKQMDFSYIYSGPVNTVENINEIVMCSSGLLFHIYLVKSENISLCPYVFNTANTSSSPLVPKQYFASVFQVTIVPKTLMFKKIVFTKK